MSVRIFILSGLFLLSFHSLAQQYSGGNGNGFDTRLKTNAILAIVGIDSLYKGGTNNGFANKSGLSLQLGIADSLYSGGNGNGFNTGMGLIIQLGAADSLYIGGIGNGFVTNIKTSAAIFMVDSLYNGGTGRGEITINGTLNLDTCGITVTWNGSLSNVWAEPANWDCGVVPVATSNVFIPSGKPWYPSIFTSTEIRSLSVQNGASVTVKTTVNFKINGH
ncbi:MAG: hypothetical protein V4722_01780 [Bacteroidota bacterium]